MKSPERSSQFAQIRDKFPDPSLTIIYNKTAGIYKKNPLRALHFRHTVHALEHLLGGTDFMNFDVQMRPTKSASHAEDVVHEAVTQGHGGIVVIGGDGTVAPVAHAIASSEGHKPHLVVAGGGTMNIFRRELTHKNSPFTAVIDELVNGHPTEVDVGIATSDAGTFPFMSNFGINTDAQVLELWKQAGRKHRGELFSIFWKNKHNFKPYDLHIQDPFEMIDQQYDDVIALPIVNAGPYAGFFTVTDSDLSDGMLEGIVLPSPFREPAEFAHLISRAVTPGRTIEGAHYLPIKNAVIRETNGEEIVFQHDGEPQRAGSSEIRVLTLPRSVTVWSAKIPIE